jgi:hypothetical protein
MIRSSAMSRVAIAESQSPPGVLAFLSASWTFTELTGSLSGKLKQIDIQAQLHEAESEPGVLSTNALFGTVESTGGETVFGLLNGQTVLLKEQPQQFVSFTLIIEGQAYTFFGGVLSADGLSIDGGDISRDRAVDDDDTDFVEDGTWSAQAQPGFPGDDHDRRERRRRAGHRRQRPR